MKSPLALGAALAIALIACQQNPPTALQTTPRALGIVEIGFDASTQTGSINWVPDLRTSAVLPNQSSVVFTPSAFSVTTNGTQKYLTAQFSVTNNSGGALQDLTLVAYQKTGNQASTAIKNLQNFAGLSPAQLDTYAQAAKPIHGMNATLPLAVNSSTADLQVFTESETATLQTQAASLLQPGEYLFPYGFTARASATSRNLPIGTNTGLITAGITVPDSNEPSSSVTRFSMTFIAFTSPTAARVAESLEEQGASSGANARATSFNAAEIALLAGSNLAANDKQKNICRVRTAGPSASPLAYLGPSSLPSSSGSFDACFGASGKRTSSFGTVNLQDQLNDMLVQTDGKIVAVGFTGNNSTLDDFLAMRFNPDGSLDNSFGSGGKVSLDITNIALGASASDQAFKVVQQSDGKLVIAGYYRGNGTTQDSVVVRLNTNGSLDTSFDTDGIATFAVAATGSDSASALALDGTGNIVVTGTFINGTQGFDVYVTRFNTNGAQDTGFGSSGYTKFFFTQTQTANFNDQPSAIKVLTSGQILVVGSNGENSGDIGLARLSSSGALDGSFGTGGKVVYNGPAGFDNATDLTVDGSGNLLVAGCVTVIAGQSCDTAVVKFNASGVLQTGFGSSGAASVAFDTVFNDTANSIALDGSGRIVLAGSLGTGAARDSTVARFTAAGALDTSFNGTGKLVAAFSVVEQDRAKKVVVQSDGKLLVAGWLRVTATPDEDFYLMRVNP